MSGMPRSTKNRSVPFEKKGGGHHPPPFLFLKKSKRPCVRALLEDVRKLLKKNGSKTSRPHESFRYKGKLLQADDSSLPCKTTRSHRLPAGIFRLNHDHFVSLADELSKSLCRAFSHPVGYFEKGSPRKSQSGRRKTSGKKVYRW